MKSLYGKTQRLDDLKLARRGVMLDGKSSNIGSDDGVPEGRGIVVTQDETKASIAHIVRRSIVAR